MHHKGDILWKGILEDVFDDFLRFLYPEADKLFDFSKRIEFLDKELEQLFPPEGDAFAPKVIDKLAKVYTHDGETEWILVHVEVQDKFSQDFGKRMFQYFYRILDKYNRRITAWAVLTENNNVVRSNVFQMEYLGTAFTYQFNIYKLALQKEDELLASNNPFALVSLTAKAAFTASKTNTEDFDQQLLELKLTIAKRLLRSNFPKEKVRKMMDFLKYYTNFEKQDTEKVYNEKLIQLTDNKTTMGIEELLIARAEHYGKLEGAENQQRIVVENAIIKFGFTDEQAASISGTTLDFVKEVREQISKK